MPRKTSLSTKSSHNGPSRNQFLTNHIRIVIIIRGPTHLVLRCHQSFMYVMVEGSAFCAEERQNFRLQGSNPSVTWFRKMAKDYFGVMSPQLT